MNIIEMAARAVLPSAIKRMARNTPERPRQYDKAVREIRAEVGYGL